MSDDKAIAALPMINNSDGPAPGWVKQVAVITGVLAALAGFLTVRGTNLSNEAIYHSNQAVLHQNLASDAWAEYQANSLKAHIADTAAKTSTGTVAGALAKEAADYSEKKPIHKDRAQQEERLREEELKFGKHRLGEKDTLDYAGVAAQLGIAMASVAALTRRKDMFYVSIAIGVGAVLVTGYGLFGHFFGGTA